ncbi:MAG TPA: S41 family peptidase [candidate division Zixibacteria bacterium]|nr:S41 family peptidase [candidate division Zixibacteria bacterium]
MKRSIQFRTNLSRKTNVDTIHAVSLWLLIFVAMGLAFLSSTVYAQGLSGPDDKPVPVDHKTQGEIIDSISASLNEIYVFPKVAKEMENMMRKQYKNHAYDTLKDLRSFTRQLTDDMRSISHDKHLFTRYVTDQEIASLQTDSLTPEERQKYLTELERRNFGFYKVEHLPGNIGYLDLRGFYDADNAGPTAVAAMNLLANSDAVIIDLRQNGGGSPSMIQLISSYFLKEPQHLNSFYIRQTDSIRQFWSSAWVPGKPMYDVDLYVLTSSYTFSAAEEFTYDMKNLKRATIVGETTGGGAHPVEATAYSNLHVGLRVPFGRAINPISGTNWEGTGVEPDIKVPADNALDAAKLDALKKIEARTTDEDRLRSLKWAESMLESILNPVQVDTTLLKTYVGKYGERTITYEDGKLFYQRVDRPKMQMIPMANDLFRFVDLDYFKLKVVTDSNGNPTELVGLYDNGHTDSSPRDK